MSSPFFLAMARKRVKSGDGGPISSKYDNQVADAASKEERRKKLQRIYDNKSDLEAF